MLAREGWIPVTGVCLVAALVGIGAGMVRSLPLWALVVVLMFIFRDPARKVPALPLAIVSPVDGEVISVRETQDPWLKRRALCISIRMRAPGISTLRSPTEGKVMDLWTTAKDCTGRSQVLNFLGNQACYVLWVRTDEGDDVLFAVSANRLYSRFKSNVAPGERIGQGHRNGFVYFGKRVDVLVPPCSRDDISEGRQVLAGSGVIATLTHA